MHPTRMIFAIGEDETGLPGLLAERKAIEGQTVEYRCVDTHCEIREL